MEPTQSYEERLKELYKQRNRLNNEDLSTAHKRREEGIALWDNFGHDAICWNARNSRKVELEITYLETLIGMKKVNLATDGLAEEFVLTMGAFKANDYRLDLHVPSLREKQPYIIHDKID